MEPYIPQVPMAPAVAPTYAPSNVEQPRHAVVSITIWVVVSNVIYFSYRNTIMVVFYFIGCLPRDR